MFAGSEQRVRRPVHSLCVLSRFSERGSQDGSHRPWSHDDGRSPCRRARTLSERRRHRRLERRLGHRDVVRLGVQPGRDEAPARGLARIREDVPAGAGRVRTGVGRLPRRDAGAVRGKNAAGRLLRRLERHSRLDQPGSARAARFVHPAAEVPRQAVLPAPPGRLQGNRRAHLRLPEGLVAAGHADEHAPAPAGGGAASDDAGADHRSRHEAPRRHARRGPADLPVAELGPPARVRLPERRQLRERPGQAHDGRLASHAGDGELVRRPDQPRARRDTGAARRRLVRRGARQGEGGDRLRGQLGGARDGRRLPDRPLRHQPDGRGHARARQSRVHRLLLDGEGREEQAGRLAADPLPRLEAGDEDVDVEGPRAALAGGRPAGQQGERRSSPTRRSRARGSSHRASTRCGRRPTTSSWPSSRASKPCRR